jgi:hypothetical protein
MKQEDHPFSFKSIRDRAKHIPVRIFPWALFLAFLLWGWRVKDLFHNIPAYGDALEQLWGIAWYGDHLFGGGSPSLFPLVFHPQGWLANTSANSPAMMLALAPFYKLGGAAFAFNIASLLSFFVAFAGMFRLARKFTVFTWLATVAALLFTFWGCRWIRINGHLHMLLSTALIPWILLCLERGIKARQRYQQWFVVTGVLWGVSIAFSFYFVWIGGILILTWLAGRRWGGRASWRQVLVGVLVSGVSALIISSPVLISFATESAAGGVSFYNIAWINSWGVSLNTFPLPFIFHPWMGAIARDLYGGSLDESSLVNFGVVASILVMIGLWETRRDKAWRPIWLIMVIGLLLSLGFTLRWNGETIPWAVMRPIDSMIWQIGHRLKPAVFTTSTPQPPLDQGIPLPGLLLAALVPFWEGARTLSRYVFIAAPGIFLLVIRGVEQFRWRAIRILLGVLLLFEVVPFASGNVSASPPSHPAFEWLRQETQPQEGIVDLSAPSPQMLELLIRGETLWATGYHNRPTAAGPGSMWPAHTWFLRDWLLEHPQAVQNPDFAQILRYYRVNYLLLHMLSSNENAILKDAESNPALQKVGCFDPPDAPSPWAYPICIWRVMSPGIPGFSLLPREGWSAGEAWGVWAEGAVSRAQWVATARSEAQLLVEAFPQCVPGQNQSITVEVNGVPLLTYTWEDCQPWRSEVAIPASVVRVGWNDLNLHYGYAASPVDVTNGANPDPRPLSVGFTQLEVRHLD